VFSEFEERICAVNSDAKAIDIATLQAAAANACGLLKVLANPDRLLLLCQLTQGELCVSDLEQETGIRQPTLSQQLTVLREEQLVATRREGKQIFYSIDSKETIAIMQTLYELYCVDAKGKKGSKK
jgi:DNA-binding transcriptional ArsR family regulator